MKKVLLTSVLSIFLGASVLFSGCGSTDLSEINKQIADLQQQITESNKIIDNLQSQIADSNQTIDNLESQIADSNQTIDNLESQIADSNQTSENLKSQITSLNQTILELQTELQNATGNISSLQSQLAIASANYDKLYNQVYGIDNNYQHLNETTSYSHNGNILFEFKPTRAVIGASGVVMEYEFTSHIKGFSTFDDFKLTALLYTDSTQLTYTVIDSGVDSQGNNFIRFTPDNFDNATQTGIVYIFISNMIFAKYEFSFV